MEAFTFNDLTHTAIVIAGIWAFYKIVVEIVKVINAKHDKEKQWDATADSIRKEREEVVCHYNEQLTDIRNKQTEIRTEFDKKVQEVQHEQLLIVECLRAVLSGLHEQGCNGAVTEALNKLDNYMVERAHQ